jgi:hypothetical protein
MGHDRALADQPLKDRPLPSRRMTKLYQPFPRCTAFVGQWTSLRENSYAFDSAAKASRLAWRHRLVDPVSIGEYILENGPGGHWCAVCDI